MRVKVLFFFAFLLFVSLVYKQNFKLINKERINKGLNVVCSDITGSLYYLYNNRIEKKVNNSSYQYSSIKLGTISFLDTRNPLNILAFSKEFNQFLLLDKFLIPKSEIISLTESGFNNVDAICLSNDNGFWIWNGTESKIKKINADLKLSFESQNINNILGFNPKNVYLKEENGNLFLLSDTNQISSFDLSANFIKNYSFDSSRNLKINNSKVYYFKNDFFYSYNLKTLIEEEILINYKINPDYFLINNKNLHLIKGDSLYYFIN